MPSKPKTPAKTPTTAKRASAAAKRKAAELSSDGDSDDAVSKRPAKKTPAKKKTSAKKGQEDSVAEEEELEVPDVECVLHVRAGAACSHTWNSWSKDESWSTSLAQTVHENEEYRCVLYPSPGAHPLHGGGTRKVDVQWLVARDVFSRIAQFKENIALAEDDAKARKKWGKKIKNRLAAYITCSRASHSLTSAAEWRRSSSQV
jgi:hypothetical protein